MKAFLFATLVATLLESLLALSAQAQVMDLPPEVRAYYRNPDGSCVQCSNGMVGWWHRDLNQASLLFDTPYGRAERGGSDPSRVADYCNRRGIRAYNITGAALTFPAMKLACKTNRFAAIGAGGRHFQTLYGYVEGDPKPWRVCNNNSTQKIDEYTEEGFRQLHLASGAWIVVHDGPSPPSPPIPTDWWARR